MLGAEIGAHKAGVKAYLLSAMAIMMAMAFVSGAYNESVGLDRAFGALSVAATVLTLGLIYWILSLRISFHERGIAVGSCVHSKELLWEDVEHFYYGARRQSFQNIPLGTTYRFRLKGRGGATISFGNLLVNVVSNPGAVGQKLIQYCGPPLLEKMRAEYNNGSTLTLGPLRLGPTGGFSWAKYLHPLPFPLDRLPKFFGESRLPVGEIGECVIVGGYLCLIKAGELRPRVRFAVSKVPNVFALRDLLKELPSTGQKLSEANSREVVGGVSLINRIRNWLKRLVVGATVRFEGQLILLLLAGTLGGPVVAYFAWSDGERIRNVSTRGVETVAWIEEARRFTWKEVNSYRVNLAWKDEAGAERRVKDVLVPGALEGKIIHGDALAVSEVRIKYLADDASIAPIFVENVGDDEAQDRFWFNCGLGATALGLIGFGLLYLFRRPA